MNWLIALLWESILKPLLSTLQPDINDKLSPLRGEYLPQLLEKYDISQIEQKFGGGLTWRRMSLRPSSHTRPSLFRCYVGNMRTDFEAALRLGKQR